MKRTTRYSRKYVPSMDGLRALAVLVVIFIIYNLIGPKADLSAWISFSYYPATLSPIYYLLNGTIPKNRFEIFLDQTC
ncbi:Uncharacterised protein [Listeria grayi]|uniref:Uncharacterized protein n=1 Tax=Listeria grayi TaxID=1641 RepID=A0A378MB44_LISGR|nr:Uncharacterised protein [Listeria grayi]